MAQFRFWIQVLEGPIWFHVGPLRSLSHTWTIFSWSCSHRSVSELPVCIVSVLFCFLTLSCAWLCFETWTCFHTAAWILSPLRYARLQECQSWRRFFEGDGHRTLLHIRCVQVLEISWPACAKHSFGHVEWLIFSWLTLLRKNWKNCANSLRLLTAHLSTYSCAVAVKLSCMSSAKLGFCICIRMPACILPLRDELRWVDPVLGSAKHTFFFKVLGYEVMSPDC